eukprot:827058-Ditylum_brightwellii.AAC.1
MSTKMDAIPVLLHDIKRHIMGQETKNPKETLPETGAMPTVSQDVPPASITTNKSVKDVVSVLMSVWKAIEKSCDNEQKMMLTHQVATPDPSSP